MALVAASIQKQMESAIMSAFMANFPEGTSADPESHQKMASAIAQGVCTVLITAIQTQAQVLPGIPTAGSPAAQVTTAPGVIF